MKIRGAPKRGGGGGGGGGGSFNSLPVVLVVVGSLVPFDFFFTLFPFSPKPMENPLTLPQV